MRRAVLTCISVIVCLAAGVARPVVAAAQADSVDQSIRDLSNPDRNVRVRAAQLLKQSPSVEAAVPLAAAVTDPDEGVRLEAIAAELNIFLGDRIVPRKRVALVVEKRNRISADAAFDRGPLALGPEPVPPQVLVALRTAIRDESPRVAIEALYAFGVLGTQTSGRPRDELLRAAAPELAANLGAQDPAFRLASLRVVGRLYARRFGDQEVDATLGDAVVSALNENDRAIKVAAMDALGAMRYGRALQGLHDLFAYYEKGELRLAAFSALAQIAHPMTAPTFIGQLSSQNAVLRTRAIEGLARVGDRATLAGIQASVGLDTNAGVQLAGAFAAALLSDASIDPIAEALPRLHDQAFGYLVELAPGRTAAFARYLQDPEPRLRADIADVLGLAADPAALPRLEPLSADPYPQVAAAAQRAVARLRVP